jgi:hypothetical protein
MRQGPAIFFPLLCSTDDRCAATSPARQGWSGPIGRMERAFTGPAGKRDDCNLRFFHNILILAIKMVNE